MFATVKQMWPTETKVEAEGEADENTNEEEPVPQGIFSFVYYYKSDSGPFSFDSVYMRGILAYIALTEPPDDSLEWEDWSVRNTFAKWRVAIYTNQETYDVIREADVDGRLKSVYFQIVEGEPDLLVLRLYRFHAFFQWRDIPVFVRDADTLFPQLLSRGDFSKRIGRWEAEYYRQFQTTGKTFCVAVQPGAYTRAKHHYNIYYKKQAEQGAYAGCISSLSFPYRQSLWEDILLYVKYRCRLVKETGANTYGTVEHKYAVRWGTDEQIILFVILPETIKDTYFFYLEYVFSDTKLGLTSRFYDSVWELYKTDSYKMRNYEEYSYYNEDDVPPFLLDGELLPDDEIEVIWDSYMERSHGDEEAAKKLPNPFTLLDKLYVQKVFVGRDDERYGSDALAGMYKKQIRNYRASCQRVKNTVSNRPRVRGTRKVATPERRSATNWQEADNRILRGRRRSLGASPLVNVNANIDDPEAVKRMKRRQLKKLVRNLRAQTRNLKKQSNNMRGGSTRRR